MLSSTGAIHFHFSHLAWQILALGSNADKPEGYCCHAKIDKFGFLKLLILVVSQVLKILPSTREPVYLNILHIILYLYEWVNETNE